jgi:hypothetical protein
MRKPSASAIAIGNAEIGERLPQIEIGFAGRHDAKPRRLAVEHDAVEPVGACKRADRRRSATLICAASRSPMHAISPSE